MRFYTLSAGARSGHTAAQHCCDPGGLAGVILVATLAVGSRRLSRPGSRTRRARRVAESRGTAMRSSWVVAALLSIPIASAAIAGAIPTRPDTTAPFLPYVDDVRICPVRT